MTAQPIKVVATGARGAVGIRWMGAWAAGTYAKRSAVTHSDSLWFATTRTSGVPGVSGDWARVLDGSSIAEDREAAEDAATAAAASAAAAAADAVDTAADAVQTAADRVQTGADRTATTASATAASSSAVAADASADAAALSATQAATVASGQLYASLTAAWSDGHGNGDVVAIIGSGDVFCTLYTLTTTNNGTAGPQLNSAAYFATFVAALSSLAPIHFSFGGKPVFWDPTGRFFSQARTLAFPRTLRLRRWDGEFASPAAIGTESTLLPGYTELQMGTTASDIGNMQTVWFNEGDGLFHKGLLSTETPTRASTVWILASVMNRAVDGLGFTILSIDDLPWAHGDTFMVYDQQHDDSGRVLKVAGVAATWGPMGVTRVVNPGLSDPPTQFCAEFDGFGETSHQILCFDMGAAIDGATTAADLLRVVTAETPPDKLLLPMVSGRLGHLYSHSNCQILGAMPGGQMANQFKLGRNGVEIAENYYYSTAPVELTDATALDMGFTHGMADTEFELACYYGHNFEKPTKKGFVFARVYQICPTDDDFRTLKITGVKQDGTLSQFGTMVQETVLTARCASYIFAGYIDRDDAITGFMVGANFASSGWTVNHQIFGLQGGISHEGRKWILTNDYPDPEEVTSEIVLPAKIHIFTDRALPLYPKQMFKTVGNEDTIVNVIGYKASDNNRVFDHASTGIGAIPLKGSEVEGAIRITARKKGTRSLNRDILTPTIVTAPSTNLDGVTPTILYIGDSITDSFGAANKFQAKLVGYDAAPIFIGTKSRTDPDGTPAVLTEARDGTQLAALTYQVTDRPGVTFGPLAAGSETAYLAMSATDKKAYNVFLRQSTGGGDPMAAYAQNGYIFDPEFWRTRWASPFAVPDYVFINVTTNDAYLNNGDDALDVIDDQCDTSLPIIYEQLRDAWADSYIVFVTNPLTASARTDQAFVKFGYLWDKINVYIRAQSDAKLLWVPGHAMATNEAPNVHVVVLSDTASGRSVVEYHDVPHYRAWPSYQVADACCALVANTI